MDRTVDWIRSAQQLFKAPKPTHFTNADHCCECNEHNQTLLACDVDSIGLRELGNPAWDPLCCCTSSGVLYYFPALIRLTLATIKTPESSYLAQLLFHLIGDGPDNRLVRACNPAQRQFIADFLAALIEHHSPEIEATLAYADDILIAYAIWQA